VYSLHKICLFLHFQGLQRILSFFCCSSSAQWKLMLHFCSIMVAICPSQKRL
jgi:p-aminobenzoyl-glutamate transporter AbgT